MSRRPRARRAVATGIAVAGVLLGGCASRDTRVEFEQTAPPTTLAGGPAITPLAISLIGDGTATTTTPAATTTVTTTAPPATTTAPSEPSTVLALPAPTAATAPPPSTAAPSTAPASPPVTERSTTSPPPMTAAATTMVPATTTVAPTTRRPTTAPTTSPGTAPGTTATTPTTSQRAPLAPSPGFDGSTIRLGLLTTTQHPIWGTIGRAITAGIEARVAAINSRGGIAGRYRIELVKAETNYDPTETVAQLQATKDRVAAYVSILGTPSVEATEPLLRAEGLLAAPASQEARWADAPNLLPVFNSYQVQAINGIAYFVDQFAQTNPGVKPIVCGVSVGTSFGDAGTEGIKAAAARLPLALGPIVTVSPTETSFASAAGALRGAGCQATFLTVGPAQTLGLVLTGRQIGLSTRWIIMGASFSDRIVTPQTGPLFEQSTWVVGDGTQWGDTTVPGMVQLRNELLAANHRYWTENPDVGLSFGWAQARTLEAVLETAVARGDLSRAGILVAAAAVGTVDIGGIGSPIDYSQPTRLANARTTVFAVDNSYRNAIRVLARDYASPAAAAYRR